MTPTIIHRVTAFVLVFILFAHNINTLAIIGDFVINQDYIAKTLCVQKEEQKGCNGKCHLRKELSENNNNSNSEAPIQESKRLVLDAFFITAINQINTANLEFQTRKEKLAISAPKTIKIYLEIDTPPPNFC